MGKSAELAQFFEPRVSPSSRDGLRSIIDELVAQYPDASFASLAGRLSVRGKALICSHGSPFTGDVLGQPVPRLESEMRLAIAERLSDISPGETPQATSASQWHERFASDDIHRFWKEWAARRDAGRAPPHLQFYTHVPFCRTTCSFCLCPSIIQRNSDEPRLFIEALERQADAFYQAVGPLHANVAAIGGGTPSQLSAAELDRLFVALRDRVFTIDEDSFFSVEFNPDSTTGPKLETLARHGVNRVGFGVQSLHPDVLKAVARGYQTRDQVLEALALARRLPFKKISVDLLTPLPGETAESFRAGLRTLLSERPHQIVIYHYQPVWRGGRLFEEGKALLWADASNIVLAEAEGAGYLADRNQLGMVLNLPGSHTFPERYEQFQTSQPFSTLAMGPMARSEIFGGLDYVTEWAADGSFEYRGDYRNEDTDRRTYVCRAIGSGQPVRRENFVSNFGEELDTLYSEEFAVLEELNWLTPTHEGWNPVFEKREAAGWLLMDRQGLSRVPAMVRRRSERRGRERLKSDLLDIARVATGLLRRPSSEAELWVEGLDDESAPFVGSWLEVIVARPDKWSWWVASDVSFDCLAWEGREAKVVARFERIAQMDKLRFDPHGLAIVARLEVLGSIDGIVLRWRRGTEHRVLELEAKLRTGAGAVAEWFGLTGELGTIRLHGSGKVWLERPPTPDGHVEIVDIGGESLGIRSGTENVPPMPPLVREWCRLQSVEPIAQDVFRGVVRLIVPSRPKSRSLKVVG